MDEMQEEEKEIVGKISVPFASVLGRRTETHGRSNPSFPSPREAFLRWNIAARRNVSRRLGTGEGRKLALGTGEGRKLAHGSYHRSLPTRSFLDSTTRNGRGEDTHGRSTRCGFGFRDLCRVGLRVIVDVLGLSQGVRGGIREEHRNGNGSLEKPMERHTPILTSTPSTSLPFVSLLSLADEYAATSSLLSGSFLRRLVISPSPRPSTAIADLLPLLHRLIPATASFSSPPASPSPLSLHLLLRRSTTSATFSLSLSLSLSFSLFIFLHLRPPLLLS